MAEEAALQAAICKASFGLGPSGRSTDGSDLLLLSVCDPWAQPQRHSWTSAPREATEVDEVILSRNKTCIGRNRLEAFAQVLLNRPFAMKRSVLF